MKRRMSYHVHTTFCDGSDSPETMVRSAIKQGMTDLGFSAHAMWPFSTQWHLNPGKYTEYCTEILRLKKKHAKNIQISLGFEADYISGLTSPNRSVYGQFNPDFLIGSIHYVPAPTHYGSKTHKPAPWCVDASANEVERGIQNAFGGDGKRAMSAYWGTIREMVEGGDFEILGHADLPRKRNGILRFFDENTSWYRHELKKTVRVIARHGKIMELNTGAIPRGIKDLLYPSSTLLTLAYKAGIPITINSDAHDSAHVLGAYDSAREAALRAGYRTVSILDPDGWKSVSLD